MPKEDQLLGPPRRLLAFYKQYRRKLIDYTKENRLEILPTDEWWVVTYLVWPAINLINITFTLPAKDLVVVACATRRTYLGADQVIHRHV
jgi:hypothetical protein